MTTVTNQHGKKLDWDAAFNLMDDDICNDFSVSLPVCSEQKFFDVYCKAHQEKFDEEFELSKANPVW